MRRHYGNRKVGCSIVCGAEIYPAVYDRQVDYDIRRTENGFQMSYERFEQPAEKSFEDDEMLGGWLENPVAYGAFENGHLIGYAEGSLETWNNRWRISNIGVLTRRGGTAGLVRR